MHKWLPLTILLVMSGCARAPDHAQHTVQDYRRDPQLRRELLERCANDPGTLGQTPDCVNVRAAEEIEGIGSMRTLPPLQLPQPPKK
jgi:hypothetical protein